MTHEVQANQAEHLVHGSLLLDGEQMSQSFSCLVPESVTEFYVQWDPRILCVLFLRLQHQHGYNFKFNQDCPEFKKKKKKLVLPVLQMLSPATMSKILAHLRLSFSASSNVVINGQREMVTALSFRSELELHKFFRKDGKKRLSK